MNETDPMTKPELSDMRETGEPTPGPLEMIPANMLRDRPSALLVSDNIVHGHKRDQVRRGVVCEVQVARGRFKDQADSDARRLAACWNACQGLNPEGYPDVIAELQKWVDYFDHLESISDPNDPLAEARKVYHGKRLEGSRAALRKAGVGRE